LPHCNWGRALDLVGFAVSARGLGEQTAGAARYPVAGSFTSLLIQPEAADLGYALD